jgi:histidinol dehydrogenase
MERAARNIENYHRHQIREGFVLHVERQDEQEKQGEQEETKGEKERNDIEHDIILGQRITPIERVGIHIPGFTAALPSSLLMGCIPAKLAGVSEVIIVTPPRKDKSVNPVILAAAKIAGADRVLSIAGAQAIAALAYGTQKIPAVDKITGAGNAYVAEAKRQVYGIVGIDMIAGPSDVLIIADSKAEPEFVAADMLSQCEHGEDSIAILITDSLDLANEVSAEIETQLETLPREEFARKSVDNNGKIIITESIEQAFEISNKLAPEHLEIFLPEPMKYLDKIKNAGSVFLGKHTPEALGDYYAGPNNTLPTLGTARFSSPLSVDDFVKRSSFTYYSQEALQNAADDVVKFAKLEDLQAHARSVLIRNS